MTTTPTTTAELEELHTDATDPTSATMTPAVFEPVTLEVEPFSFDLPPEFEATEPAEARGITRDAVRLMVAHTSTHEIEHTAFTDFPRQLDRGDIVVVNTSQTLAAELDGVDAAGEALLVHLSTQLPDGLWSVELRRGDGPLLDEAAGEVIGLPAGGRLTLLAPYGQGPATRRPRGTRLWAARLELPGDPALHTYLAVNGRPIRYGYVRGSWPIAFYQNVYATEPGSAEMPSAGRPFTPEILTRLVAKGVEVAPVLLHTGVASLEASEPPYPEYFEVTSHTARRINSARAAGGRVIAVGTTVVRTLESVVDDAGRVHPGRGYTETVVTPQRPPTSIDGLLTGWHEPEASHLALLESVAGRELLEESYRAALEEGYRWHEFGDVHLVLP